MPRRNFDASMIARLREDQNRAAYLRRQRLLTGPPISSGTNNLLLNPQTTNYTSTSQTQTQNGMETTYINGSLRNVYGINCVCDFNEVLPAPFVPPTPPVPPTPDFSEGYGIWATSQPASIFAYVTNIKADRFGNIYMLVSFMGTLTLNNYVTDAVSPISVSPYGTLTNNDQTDMCLVKYNSNGQVQWATTISGVGLEASVSLAVDSTGNVVLAGLLGSNTTIFTSFVSGGGGGAITLTTYGTLTRPIGIVNYTCLVKYDPNGIVQWVTQLTANNQLIRQYVAIDTADNIYLYSYKLNILSTSITIFNQGGVVAGAITPLLYGAVTTTINSEAAIIVKYTTNGFAVWGTKLELDGNSLSGNIETTSDGGLLVSGIVTGTGSPFSVNLFSLVPSSPPQVNTTLSATISHNGPQFLYLAKYNTNGIFQWATDILLTTGTVSPNNSLQIATDTSNNAYVIGGNPGTIAVNSFSYVMGGTVVTTPYGSLQVPVGTLDTYLVKYNGSGVAQWGTSITNSTEMYASGLATDASNNVYVSGVFDSPITVDSFVSDSGGGNLNTTPFGILPLHAGTVTYFLIKYTSDGTARWATSGTASEISPVNLVKLTCSKSDYVYLASSFLPSLFDINNYGSVSGGSIQTTLYNSISHDGDSYTSALVKYKT